MRISDWSSDVCSSDLFGLQQRERRAQRLGIIGADRTDQDFTAVGQADLLVPRGKAIAGAHAGKIASMTLKNPRRREERVFGTGVAHRPANPDRKSTRLNSSH